MDEHTDSRRPGADAFRDTVRGEDPSTWGTRDRMDTNDIATYPAGEPTRASRVATGPVGTDPTASTYAGTPTTPVTHVDRRDHRLGDPVRSETVIEERGHLAHAEPPVEDRRFSVGATFLGWAVAAFFTIVFSAIVLALFGGAAAQDGQITLSDANGLAVGTFVGYLVAAFLAYLIGGYAAGRIALWDGVKHGLLTVAWAVLFAVLGVLAGVYLADATNLQAYFVGIDFGALTGETILAVVLSLAVMLGGAALGGKAGERYHDRVHGIDTRSRRTRRVGGRPL